ncbi:MAG: hypothetical protein ACXAEU_14215 [Candidatus Hodarchaeales archaeon]|jgi:hypothetical protein
MQWIYIEPDLDENEINYGKFFTLVSLPLIGFETINQASDEWELQRGENKTLNEEILYTNVGGGDIITRKFDITVQVNEQTSTGSEILAETVVNVPTSKLTDQKEDHKQMYYNQYGIWNNKTLGPSRFKNKTESIEYYYLSNASIGLIVITNRVYDIEGEFVFHDTVFIIIALTVSILFKKRNKL